MSFCDWLISFSTRSSRLIYVLAYVKNLAFLMLTLFCGLPFFFLLCPIIDNQGSKPLSFCTSGTEIMSPQVSGDSLPAYSHNLQCVSNLYNMAFVWLLPTGRPQIELYVWLLQQSGPDSPFLLKHYTFSPDIPHLG